MSTRNSGIQPFINWREDYDSHLKIIDKQHQGILNFINHWYNDIKGKVICQENVISYMREKFSYLEFYSKAHLAFEGKMLELLAAQHGFPRAEVESHLKIHQAFIAGFMQIGSEQLGLLIADKTGMMLDSIAEDSLRDVARWWFGHIRASVSGNPSGPDHQYRLFLRQMPAEAKVDLLNDLILYFEESTVNPAAT